MENKTCRWCQESHDDMDQNLSYDGFGINNCDAHRSRIAKFTDPKSSVLYGPIFAESIGMYELLERLVQRPAWIQPEGENLQCDYCYADHGVTEAHRHHRDDCILKLAQQICERVSSGLEPDLYYEVFKPDPYYAIIEFTNGEYGLISRTTVINKHWPKNNLLPDTFTNIAAAEICAEAWIKEWSKKLND